MGIDSFAPITENTVEVRAKECKSRSTRRLRGVVKRTHVEFSGIIIMIVSVTYVREVGYLRTNSQLTDLITIVCRCLSA